MADAKDDIETVDDVTVKSTEHIRPEYNYWRWEYIDQIGQQPLLISDRCVITNGFVNAS